MEEYWYNGLALQVVQSFCPTSLILLKFFVAKMVLDEVGPGVFGITRNNESINWKAAITSYNSYDSLTVFSQRDYANSFGSYVRAKRDSLVQDRPVWSGPQNNLHELLKLSP
ncbi:uncharacterized protein LOC110882175 [Helianthus annuus]|uniref:uncharacterized protein LOC110882175 n=1 Tax=Helianthus annuus TaxID=4232 RepID=UPI001652EF7B|nr:uncharacterized protein LOC110882175 [Helianthus annuus]